MSTAANDPVMTTPGRLPFNTLVMAIVIACSFFMETLDSTVLVTAIPQMAKSFGVRPVDLGLSITAYVLSMAVVTPCSAWIADRFGARTIYACAIVLFTASSVGCGLAHGFWPFIAARAVQGLGGALMSPVGRIVQLRQTSKSDLVRAITIATAPGLVAPVLGPPIGGFITTYFSWPWIFFLNVPIGFIGVFMVLKFCPNTRSDNPKPFDRTGFFLNGFALACLVYGLADLGSSPEWQQPAGLTVLGFVIGAFAIRHGLRAAHPLIPLTTICVRSFRLTSVTAGLLLRLAAFCIPFILPLLFQIGFGLSAFLSGLLFLGHTVGDLAAKAITARVQRTLGFRNVLIYLSIAFAVSLGACALFTAQTPFAVMFAVLFVSGSMRSLLYTALGTLAYADMPREEMGNASVLAAMMLQLNRALGISLIAIVMNVSSVLRGAAMMGIPDFRIGILVVAVLTGISVFWWRTLPVGVGSEVSGHRAG
jgi:EmrB/QacA subfamily drug resistance transporter